MNYEQIDNLPREYTKNKIKEFLKEDIPRGDLTTDNIYNVKEIVEAQIQAGEQLIFCGKNIVMNTFDKGCKVKKISEDGKNYKKNQIIGIISGPATEILKKERVMLNLLQRLSSISTKTYRVAQKAKKYNIKLLDTRKTTPGIRLFEKYAVSVGGGENHRLDLSDGILIKDNHIIHSTITETLLLAQRERKHKIEVEVDNLKQLSAVLPLMPDGVLLDNFKPEQIVKAINIIKAHPSSHQIFIEASGGINKQSLNKYLIKDLSAISIGALTHQAKSKNIKLTKKN